MPIGLDRILRTEPRKGQAHARHALTDLDDSSPTGMPGRDGEPDCQLLAMWLPARTGVTPYSRWRAVMQAGNWAAATGIPEDEALSGQDWRLILGPFANIGRPFERVSRRI